MSSSTLEATPENSPLNFGDASEALSFSAIKRESNLPLVSEGAKELFRQLSESTQYRITALSPSGKPDKVYRVVTGQIPDELQSLLVQPFTDHERHEIFHHIDFYSAKSQQVPKAFWLFGPPAVGKTTVSQERVAELFGGSDNAVTVDGDIFRSIHKGFQMVTHHGLRNNLLHADAWPKLHSQSFFKKIKKEILEQAVHNRANVLLPEAAVSKEKVMESMRLLEQNGYEMHAVCLWAPKSETERRGKPRSVKDGKVFNSQTFGASVKNTLELSQMWETMMADKNPHYKSVLYYDNTIFPSRPIHIHEFEKLASMSDEEAAEYARMQRAQKFAGEALLRAASNARWRQAPPNLARTTSFSKDPPVLLQAERRCGRWEGFFAGVTFTLVIVLFLLVSRTSHALWKFDL